MELSLCPALQQVVIDSDTIATVHSNEPATRVRYLSIIVDGGVVAGDNLARTEIDVYRELLFQILYRARYTMHRWRYLPVVRWSPNVYCLFMHIVGPIFASDLGECLDGLGACNFVGMFSGDCDGVFGSG